MKINNPRALKNFIFLFVPIRFLLFLIFTPLIILFLVVTFYVAFFPIFGQLFLIVVLAYFSYFLIIPVCPKISCLLLVHAPHNNLSGPVGLGVFQKEGLKMVGFLNSFIPRKEIKAVVAKRVFFFGFFNDIYYYQEGVLCMAKIFTIFRKYKNVDSKKLLVLPGLFPLSIIEATGLFDIRPFFLSFFSYLGKNSPEKKFLEKYVGQQSFFNKNYILESTGGGTIGDTKYFDMIKEKLNGKISLLQVKPDLIYKFLFVNISTVPFFKIYVDKGKNITFSWHQFKYTLKYRDLNKIIIKYNRLGPALTFLHKDKKFLERITFFPKNNDLTKMKQIFKDKLENQQK